MPDEMTANPVLRPGDVYRWSYAEPRLGDQQFAYWCCSRIAIVDDRGWLKDTFWSFGGENRMFGRDDFSRLKLVFIANLADLEKKPEYEADYFDDADIVNLNHSNSSRDNFYLRKGAKRSAKKMLEVAHHKLGRARSDEKMAAWRAEELCKKIASILAGDTSVSL